MLQLGYLSQTRTERSQPNADCGSRTDRPQRQGLRFRRDPWPGQQHMQVKRASNERQRDTDQTSTRPQRYVNATSTVRQPNVNKASTEQQRVINPTIDCRREYHLQRLDEARGPIQNGCLSRMFCWSIAVRNDQSALKHVRVTAYDGSRVSQIMRPRDDQQTDGIAFGCRCTHPCMVRLRTGRLRCVDVRWYDAPWTRSVVRAVRDSLKGVRYGRSFATVSAG